MSEGQKQTISERVKSVDWKQVGKDIGKQTLVFGREVLAVVVGGMILGWMAQKAQATTTQDNVVPITKAA